MADGRLPSHAARLAKTLVLAGASLGLSGCGGESRRTVEGAGGQADASSAGGMGAGVGAGMAVGGRAGGSTQPVYTGDVEGCPSAQRVCTCTYQSAVLGVTCTLDHPLGYLEGSTLYQLLSMDCQCDGARPTGPEDCEYTQQFTCAEYAPEYEDCVCNPAAPRTPDACPKPNRYYQCGGLDPDIGCDCIAGIK